MRRQDKKVHMEKANLLFEQRCNEGNGYDWDSLKNMSREERLEAGRKYHEKYGAPTPEVDKTTKKTDESELTEVDYEKVYANTNPWDKQQVKIDDYPAEGEMLDMNIRSAEKALNGDRTERQRFLMDGNEVKEYLDKLYKIKNALNKHAAGEQLDDFEKKIVRFYKSNKQSQKARIANTAGNKLDTNFIKNFDKSQFSEYENKAIEIFSREDRSKSEAFITDINPEQDDGDSVRFRVNCKFNGEDAEFLIYQDGSNGFVGNDDLNPYVVTDSGFRNLVINTINGIRPQRNY